MTWTGRAKDEAKTRWTAITYGIEQSRLLASVFAQGAAWQRQQYESREVVERVAAELYEGDREPDAGDEPWAELHEDLRDYYVGQARAALAVLGDPR